MGVNLREIANPEDIEMEVLTGKTIAIDALNIIYQFLSIIRDRFTGEPLKDSNGRVTSHLSGIFYRTSRMLEYGMKPVFIFDGEAPEFKQDTKLARHKVREQARAKWQQAVKDGDREKTRLYSQQASVVTDDMLAEAKTLLDAMGIQYVESPSEGEAQAAYMNRTGTVDACGSQDWDSMLFGAKKLVRNLAVSGKRKLPNKQTYVTIGPQMVEMEKMLGALGISYEQLIMVGILTGTDFNPGGVKGFGPKKALEIVKEKKELGTVFNGLEWDFSITPQEIFDFFKNPPVKDVALEKTDMNIEKVQEILLDHDFSIERIKKNIERLTTASQVKQQSSLDKFM